MPPSLGYKKWKSYFRHYLLPKKQSSKKGRETTSLFLFSKPLEHWIHWGALYQALERQVKH